MRSVSGKVLSSYPISLSKSAKILSKFVSAETGASQAVCAYLRRASASFNELNHLHKELKSERPKHKKPKSEITEESPTRGFGVGLSQELSQEPSRQGGESERKKHKKKKKKRKSEEVEEGGVDGSEERWSKKKKRRKIVGAN